MNIADLTFEANGLILRGQLLNRASDEIGSLRLTLAAVVQAAGRVRIEAHAAMRIDTAERFTKSFPGLEIVHNEDVIGAEEPE